MKIKLALKVHSYLSKRIYYMLEQKGCDYATEMDTLINFRKQAQINTTLELDDSPKCQALRLLVVKLIRISNLWMNNKKPNYESLLDTVLDGMNYLQLAYMCYLSETDQTEKLEVYIDTLDKTYPMNKWVVAEKVILKK